MATFDQHKNFIITAVVVPPVPPSSGTTVTVTAGDGATFPTAPFNVTIWPVGALPSRANAEIARVTLVVGNVLTMTRAQEGTSARAILVGDQIAVTITAKSLEDIEGQVSNVTGTSDQITLAVQVFG